MAEAKKYLTLDNSLRPSATALWRSLSVVRAQFNAPTRLLAVRNPLISAITEIRERLPHGQSD